METKVNLINQKSRNDLTYNIEYVVFPWGEKKKVPVDITKEYFRRYVRYELLKALS